MGILDLDLTGIPTYLTYPAHEEVRNYLLRDYEMGAERLGIAIPPTQQGGEVDLLAGMFGTQADIIFTSLQLSNAKADPLYAEGDDLDAIRERLGLPVLPASGGAGNVTVTTTGAATWLAGDQIVFPGGIRAAVQATTSFSSATTTGQVPVACLDTGDRTNFDVGIQGTWANPPINAMVKATVAAKFKGGADTEADVDKRARIIDAIRIPQVYGTPQWVLGKIEAFPAATYAGSVVPDSAYCYRAPGGPGTFLVVVMATGTADNGWSRAVGSATIEGLRTYLSGLVVPEVHFDVRSPQAVPTDAVVQVIWTGASTKAHWLDTIPWPKLNPAGGQGVVTFSGVSGSQLLGVTATTPPAVGSRVTLCIASGATYDYTVQSYSGTSGAYVVTMTTTVSTAVSSGGFIYPSIYTPGATADAAWRAAMGTLACGELTTDERLPQCRRFPSVAIGGKGDTLYSALAGWLVAMGGAAVNATVATPGALTPPAPAGVYAAPLVLTPSRFAVYPLVGT